MRTKKVTGIVIVGCNPLSMLVTQFFQERGEKVVIIDTEPEFCAQAQDRNIQVIVSSAFDADVLKEAGLRKMGTFLAITNNGEVNFVLAQRVAEEFDPPQVLAVYSKDSTANFPANQRQKVKQAFVSNLAIKQWNEYLNNAQVKLLTTTFSYSDIKNQKQSLKELIETGNLLPFTEIYTKLLKSNQ